MNTAIVDNIIAMELSDDVGSSVGILSVGEGIAMVEEGLSSIIVKLGNYAIYRILHTTVDSLIFRSTDAYIITS